jgi:hypothetical protein
MIDLFCYRNLLIVVAVLGIRITSAQGSATLAVDDPRPVEKAVEMLVLRYGYVITYEDPRYEYGDDLEDVTSKVRKDMDKYPPGSAPKVIIPRGEKLTFSMPPVTGPQDVRSTLNTLVQISRGRGGHFRVLESGGVFHVLPTEVRDTNGNWAATGSIFDARISIPSQERTERQLIDVICTAASSAAHINVVSSGGSWIAHGISSTPSPPVYAFQANNEVARDVLTRALAITKQAKRTWLLLYDVSQRAYFLSILAVPDLSTKPQVSPAAAPQSDVGGSSAPPCSVTDRRPCRSVSK